jgi:hypothetical protein
MQREQSPAYEILRASTKRLLKFVTSEIARNGGGRVILHNDMLEMIGSRRIYLTGLFELHTLGLLDVERYPKCHACRLSDRWRDIGSVLDAKTASAVARGSNRIIWMAVGRPRAWLGRLAGLD